MEELLDTIIEEELKQETGNGSFLEHQEKPEEKSIKKIIVPTTLAEIYSFSSVCANCNNKNYTVHNKDNFIMCSNCKHISNIDIETSTRKDMSITNNTTTQTKKITHFNTWIADLNGQTNTTIPENIIECIYRELVSMSILDKSYDILCVKAINSETIRYILKKNKYNKYYSYIPFIITQLLTKNKILETDENKEYLESKKIDSQNNEEIINIDDEFISRTLFDIVLKLYERNIRIRDNNTRLSSSTFFIKKIMQLIGKESLANNIGNIKNTIRRSEYETIWRQLLDDMFIIEDASD